MILVAVKIIWWAFQHTKTLFTHTFNTLYTPINQNSLINKNNKYLVSFHASATSLLRFIFFILLFTVFVCVCVSALDVFHYNKQPLSCILILQCTVWGLWVYLYSQIWCTHQLKLTKKITFLFLIFFIFIFSLFSILFVINFYHYVISMQSIAKQKAHMRSLHSHVFIYHLYTCYGMRTNSFWFADKIHIYFFVERFWNHLLKLTVVVVVLVMVLANLGKKKYREL